MKLKINKVASLIFLMIFGCFVIFFFIMGFKADPNVLMDDGFSLKSFYFSIGSFFLVFPILIFLGIYPWIFFHNKNIQYLKKNGIPGTAIIISYHSIEPELNNLHQIELELKIQPSQNKQYTIKHKEYFNPTNIEKLYNGLKLNILTNPDNKKNILILWK